MPISNTLTLRRIRLYLPIILFLVSCTNKYNDGSIVSTLDGEIKDGQFSNSYLTMDIAENWKESKSNDESQFLVISKIRNDFEPSIILFVLNKQFYTKQFGYGSAREYLDGLTQHYIAKAEYELLSKMNSIKIDDRYFYYSEFMLLNGEKKIKQITGVAEMEEYFLAFVATDNLNNIEPEIWTTIKSLKFKSILNKNGRLAQLVKGKA
jgi:hypothetical protein